ncbi:MAG TPA: methyltransferase domain-containing protein [Gemmatimonadales bacterium]|nr:methyltransferase domain-containing protein [Gemmatimonadales bacterium]
MDKKAHWEAKYRGASPDRLSWYQAEPEPSLSLIRAAVTGEARIIDVGGGASLLVDALLAAGYAHLTVLDLSASALALARARLGSHAANVRWIEADILDASLPGEGYELWHDRAVFHFLTGAAERRRYVQRLRGALSQEGHVVIGTFAPEGPPRCSGLDVVRYSAERLRAELGPGFHLVQDISYRHQTPDGRDQEFTYCHFRRDPAGS